MNYFLENWGSFAGVLGVALTIVGIIFSIAAFKRAGKARDSADAAKDASSATRATMTSTLAVVDIQKAISLVQRLKVLHRDSSWEVCLEHYPPLRAMLSDIDRRHPLPDQEQHIFLREAIPQLTFIENTVAKALNEGREPSLASNLEERLNEIQTGLEKLASSTYFTGIEASK